MTAAIRRATAADGAAVAAIYAPFVAGTATTFELEPPAAADMGARIERSAPRWPWLVLERDGGVCGYAYAGAHRARPAYQWSVETSVYLAPGARGRGAGTALYVALLDLLRAQGYWNAYGGVTLPNPASVRLHESLGFRPLGIYREVGYKLGAWHDVGWWSLRLHPPAPNAPPPPRPIDDIATSPVWPAAVTAALRHLR